MYSETQKQGEEHAELAALLGRPPQAELRRASCLQECSTSVVGFTYLVGGMVSGGLVSALLPKRLPVNVRSAPFLVLGVAGIYQDYLSCQGTCDKEVSGYLDAFERAVQAQAVAHPDGASARLLKEREKEAAAAR